MTGYAVLQSRALNGMQAAPVHVEVHTSPMDCPASRWWAWRILEVKEARERVRSALPARALSFHPTNASRLIWRPPIYPRTRGRFDLPIALCILAASGQVDAQS